MWNSEMMAKDHFPIQTKECQSSEIPHRCKWLLRWRTVFPGLIVTMEWSAPKLPSRSPARAFTEQAIMRLRPVISKWGSKPSLCCFNKRSSWVLTILYSGTLYKISWFKEMLYLLENFLYTVLWYLREKICRIYRNSRELSPNLVVPPTLWLRISYLTYIRVSIFSIDKVGISGKVLST